MKFIKVSLLVFAVFMLLGIVGWFSVEPSIVSAEDAVLTSVAVAEAPVLDGMADDAVWANATVTEIATRRGANDGDTTIMIRSVYTEDMVYFLVEWADPTQSFVRAPWEMQADGTWIQLSDPDDKGGDNNVWYEDKLAFIWPINNSIVDFEYDGCFVACHRSSDGDPKPYGNKNTENEGELGDIWHWKSVRNLNQLDDQYLDNVTYSADTPEAGRHSDPKDSGGYVNNINEDKTGPAFMLPGTDFPRDGAPGYILESEAVPFDASLFQPGDRVPGIVKSEFVGDRGDFTAGWQWVDGVWTLEFSRALVTGSEFDVQFDDLAGVYYFGIADFDNAQVRHSFAGDPIMFVFQQ
ncbi:MAG: ethylbenzene dehydrogenase [Anaerolineaceae bacterium]|nr:ethylbenzene dehydrogenase [Anaerolineaceae bacterium]